MPESKTEYLLGASSTTTMMIVGWDQSSPAQSALEWALERSHATGNSLEILRVVDGTVTSADYFLTDDTIAAARRELDQVYKKVREVHTAQPIETRVIVGDPVEELKRMSGPRSLIVVGTHRRTGSAPRYEWSLGARLAALATGPVAIVPERTSARPGSGVVVGTDGSAASVRALDFAAEEANRTGQVLHVLHAWQRHTTEHASGEWVAPTSGRRHPPTQQRMVRRILDDAVAHVSRRHPDVQVRRELVEGPAQWALLDRTLGMSLLVVGSDGEGGLKETTLGSTAHAIVVNVRCPTIVVSGPPQGQQQ